MSKYVRKLIHISTDYVFDGKINRPLKETDKTNPLGVYGATKLKGEQHIINSALVYAILRTSWLYSSYGNNFVKTIKRLASEKEELTIISDQIGTPTYTKDLAKVILKIIPQLNQKTRELYHYSNAGVTSWYDFAQEIVRFAQLKCTIKPLQLQPIKL